MANEIASKRETLSASDRKEYNRRHERMRVIRAAAEEFAGHLVFIRENRLYCEDYDNFDDYCLEEWGITRQHAYRQIEHFKTIEAITMSPAGDTPKPSEWATRPMAGLPEEKKREVWREAVAEAGGAPTAKQVKAAREKITGFREVDDAIRSGVVPPGSKIVIETEDGEVTVHAPSDDPDDAPDDRIQCPTCGAWNYIPD